MNNFIKQPTKIPFFLKLGIWFAERKVKKTLLPARLLSWFPKSALSSGLMESLIANEKDFDRRILKLVRIQVSLVVSCPFCIDMNSFDYQKENITEQEIKSLKDGLSIKDIESFNVREKLALNYAYNMSITPPFFTNEFINDLKLNFTEKEIIILATTIAQVNYWTRLIQSLGIPPAGFSDKCKLN